MLVDKIILEEGKPRILEISFNDGNPLRYKQSNDLCWEFEEEEEEEEMQEGYGCFEEHDKIPYEDTYDQAVNLRNRERWEILEAREIGELETISSVTAKKGDDIIYVDLDRMLVGPERALIDFLNTYKEQINIYAPEDIWFTSTKDIV